MTLEELLALPVTTDVVTAGRAFNMGKNASYEAARSGTFPVQVMRLGHRYRVLTTDLVKALGLADARYGAVAAGDLPSVEAPRVDEPQAHPQPVGDGRLALRSIRPDNQASQRPRRTG